MTRIGIIRLAVLVCLASGFDAGAVRGGDHGALRHTPVVEAVQRVAPAVVNISASEIIEHRNPFSFSDPFFDQFFNRFYERRAPATSERRNLGSGFFVRGDGFVVTNNHVVAQADRIWVATLDGKEYQAALVGTDPQFDLAVLKVEGASNLPEAPLGDSDDLLIGETVVAIGNPFGLSHSITTGVVSAARRSVKVSQEMTYHDFIQTDASINPGNSGGPLINILGEVIGVNTAIYQGGEGIGFAIPINVVKKVTRDLIAFGRVQRGWFGLFIQNLTPALKESFRYQGSGVLVSRVDADGNQKEASAAVGDIIAGFGGRGVSEVSNFADIAAAYFPGDKVVAEVFRDGRKSSFTLTCRQMTGAEADRIAWDVLGLAFEKKKGQEAGLTVGKVRNNSNSQRLGIAKGDILHQVNQIDLGKNEDLIRAVLGIIYADRILIKIQRGNYLYVLSL